MSKYRNILIGIEGSKWEFTDLFNSNAAPNDKVVLEWSKEQKGWLFWEIPHGYINCGNNPEKVIKVLESQL